MASVWDDIKDLFKTKSQLAQEKQQKLNDALNKEGELLDKLRDLENQYNLSLPKEEEPDLEKLFPSHSGLEEIEYTPRSDEDIEGSASLEVNSKKTAQKNDIDSKFETSKKALDKSKDDAKQSLEDNYKQLEELYGNLKRKAENDSIKRGVARSSIILEQLNELDKAHMSSAGDVAAAYQETIGNINTRINALEGDRENALDELDLKYASELDKRINDLKDERAAAILQYEKYNNSVREKNRDYAQEREQKVTKFLKDREQQKLEAEKEQADYESKYGYSGEKLKNYAQRYNAAFEFYSSLSPDIAVDALKASPNMKYYLGQYYDKLVAALKSAQPEQKFYF